MQGRRDYQMEVKTKQTVTIELSELDTHKLALILSTFTLNAQVNLAMRTEEFRARVNFSIELEKELSEFR
jgi:hypothetical protein